MADMRPRQTAVTTPKFPRANRSKCAWATSYQKPELQNWYALTEILEASRYGVDAGTHISSLRYCHWIANLLVTQIPWNQHSPENFSAICACWTLDEDYYGLKDAKGCILEFLAGEITSSDCSASIKLPSGSPSHGFSLDDYSGSQPVSWRAYLA